jgi:hypothetical protein
LATSRITNTIKDPSGTAIASVPVQVRLMPAAGFRISDFTEVARLDATTTDSTGFWSLDLERNSNITPANSWYEVTEQVPDSAGGKRVWFIAVGDSDQSLLASLVTPAQQQPTVVPAGTVYLDQAAADARYQALGSLSAATPSQIDAGDTASAGVATSASRSDHQHAMPSGGTPVAIGLTGVNSASATTEPARVQHVHAYNPPACRVYNSANISVNDNTVTLVTFNSERYDTDSMHSTSVDTSRITFTTAGLYLVAFNGQLPAANDYSVAGAYIRLNGTTYIAMNSGGRALTGSSDLSIGVTTVYKFAAADFVEVLVHQDNTANTARNLQAVSNLSPELAATWIGVG